MNIDQNAPVTAQDEIIIHAPIETVWAIQSDLARWPEWQSNISSVQFDGELAAGKVFRWKAQGLTITSTLQVVEPPRQIGWTGVAMGMKAAHLWHFEAVPEGTKVSTEESLSGWFTRLMALFDRKFLNKSMAASLATLKRRAEEAAPSAAASV